MPDRQKPRGSIPPTVTYPLVAVAVMIAVFYGLYVPLTARQEHSFNDLAFRSLASVADQLESRLSNYAAALSQAEQLFIKIPQSGPDNAQRPNPSSEQRTSWNSYISDQLRGLRPIECSPDDLKAGSTETSVLLRRPGTQYEFRIVRVGCAVTSVDDILQPLLSAVPAEVFDEFLIADAQGQVVFQTKRTGLRVDSLKSTAFREPPDRQEAETKQESGADSNSPNYTFDEIKSATQWSQAIFQGKPYYAYTAPLTTALLKENRSPLVLCGLVAEDRFSSMVMQAPSSWLITAFMALVIIVFSSWPLLRHRAVTPDERIPRNTGLYYILSTMVTILVAFLLCVHVCYILDHEEIDGNLRTLATAINGNLSKEVEQALTVIEAAELDPDFKNLDKNESFEAEPSYIACLDGNPRDYCKVDLLKDRRELVAAYPYFDLLFWSNKESGQHAKWSVRTTVTPPTPLAGRPFYTATLQGNYWELNTAIGGDRRFRIDPVYSPNTGEYLTVISRPAGSLHEYLNAAHLVTPLLSLVQSMLPPHFGFAVVDDDGAVLFHAISAKNQRENFFDQCSDPNRIREAVRSGQLRFLDASFAGNSYRMLVRPMDLSRDIPWALIVFSDLSASSAQHIGTMLLFLCMAAAYYVVLSVLSFAALSSLRKRTQFATTDILPEAKNGFRYLHLSAVLLVALAASFWIVLDLPSYVSLLAAIAVPVFSLIMAKKYFTPYSDFTRIAVIGAVASFSLTALLFRLDPALHFWGEGPPWVSIAATGLIFLSFATLGTRHSVNAATRVAGNYYFLFYTAVCVEILLLFAFIPSLAFYNLAWDIQERLFTQREQVQVLRAIEERKARVLRYYSDVKLPLSDEQAFLRTRLDIVGLDRYDLAWPMPRRRSNLRLHPLQPLAPFGLVRAVIPIGRTSVEQELDNLGGSRWQWWQAGETLHLRRVGGEGPASGQSAYSSDEVISSLRDLTPLDFLRHLGFAVFLLVVLAFFWIRGSLRQVLGLDFRLGDAWPEVELRSSFPLSKRVLLLGDPACGKSKTIDSWHEYIFRVDMTQVINSGPSWLQSIKQPIVALDHFEYRIDDCEATAIKLDVVRRFSYELKKRVFIVSTVDPVFYWEDSYAHQARVNSEERDHIAKNRQAALELRSFETVRLISPDQGRESEANRLWLSCSPSEKVALHQLAHESWPNFKNADALRHLWNRRILSRNNRFLFRDSRFCDFVLNTVSSHERDKLAQRHAPSSWAGIQSAFLILLFGVLAATVLLMGHQMWGTIITVAGTLMTAIRLVTAMRGQGLLAILSKDSEKV